MGDVMAAEYAPIWSTDYVLRLTPYVDARDGAVWACDFELLHVVGWDHDGTIVYERKGATSSDHTTEDPADAAVAADGHVK